MSFNIVSIVNGIRSIVIILLLSNFDSDARRIELTDRVLYFKLFSKTYSSSMITHMTSTYVRLYEYIPTYVSNRSYV